MSYHLTFVANPGVLDLYRSDNVSLKKKTDEHGLVSSIIYHNNVMYLPEAMHHDLLKEAPAIWIPRLHLSSGFRTEKETPVPQI